MAYDPIYKHIWLIETIRKEGNKGITFDDLNEKWTRNEELSGGVEMLKRTFHKWKSKIKENFGIEIECVCNHYYINNIEEIKSNKTKYWLLNTFAVCNSLIESKEIKERILLEDVPSGKEHLDSIIEAMKANRLIHIDYQSYWSIEKKHHYVMPLCIKLFRQRWYLVGRVWSNNADLLFCLDRIKNFRLSSHTFEYPQDFNPTEYFAECFGIIVEKNIESEKVILKTSASQANYLRAVPMTSNQEEIERNEEYSIFQLRVKPTHDFIQELLWHREEIEILEPQELRREMKEIASKILTKYQ